MWSQMPLFNLQQYTIQGEIMGAPKIDKKRTVISVLIDTELVNGLKIEAARQSRKISGQMEVFLRDALKRIEEIPLDTKTNTAGGIHDKD